MSSTNSSLTGWDGHARGSRGYRKVLTALACAGLATFAQLYSPQGLLPLLAQNLRVPAADAALTISVATLGLASSVLPWAFVADRMGRARAMKIALVTACLLGLAVAFAPTLLILLLLRGLEGVALGGIPGVALAYLSEEISPRSVAAAAGAYIAGTSLGGLAGRLIAGPVAEVAGWRAGILVVAGACTVATVVFCVSAPAPRGFSAGGGNGLRRLWPQLRDRRLVALYVQAFALMGVFVSVYNYLGFRLLGKPFSLPLSVVSLMFLAYLAGTVSARVGASLSTRWGHRSIMLCCIALMLAGLAIMLSGILVVLLIGLVLFTAGFFGAHSIASGWTGVLAVSGRAQAASLYNLSYYAGSSIVGWLSGGVFGAAGWTGLSAALAGLALAAALVAVLALPSRAAQIRPVGMMANT